MSLDKALANDTQEWVEWQRLRDSLERAVRRAEASEANRAALTKALEFYAALDDDDIPPPGVGHIAREALAAAPTRENMRRILTEEADDDPGWDADLEAARRETAAPDPRGGAMSLRLFFRWYDLWIGAYYDRDARVLYVCPLPMVGVRIALLRGAEPPE